MINWDDVYKELRKEACERIYPTPYTGDLCNTCPHADECELEVAGELMHSRVVEGADPLQVGHYKGDYWRFNLLDLGYECEDQSDGLERYASTTLMIAWDVLAPKWNVDYTSFRDGDGLVDYSLKFTYPDGTPATREDVAKLNRILKKIKRRL